MQMKYPYFMDLWERGENRQDFISKEVCLKGQQIKEILLRTPGAPLLHRSLLFCKTLIYNTD